MVKVSNKKNKPINKQPNKSDTPKSICRNNGMLAACAELKVLTERKSDL